MGRREKQRTLQQMMEEEMRDLEERAEREHQRSLEPESLREDIQELRVWIRSIQKVLIRNGLSNKKQLGCEHETD